MRTLNTVHTPTSVLSALLLCTTLVSCTRLLKLHSIHLFLVKSLIFWSSSIFETNDSSGHNLYVVMSEAIVLSSANLLKMFFRLM